jgi:hypothetical protein
MVFLLFNVALPPINRPQLVTYLLFLQVEIIFLRRVITQSLVLCGVRVTIELQK